MPAPLGWALVCSVCGFGLRALERHEASLALPQGSTCVCARCEKRTMRALPEEEAQGVAFRTLTAHELFLAAEGQGLPEERQVTLASVAASLYSGIRRASLQQLPDGVVLEKLLCGDGTTLHLAAATEGAFCYRHQPARSAT